MRTQGDMGAPTRDSHYGHKAGQRVETGPLGSVVLDDWVIRGRKARLAEGARHEEAIVRRDGDRRVAVVGRVGFERLPRGTCPGGNPKIFDPPRLASVEQAVEF